jgi:hypothetical protein
MKIRKAKAEAQVSACYDVTYLNRAASEFYGLSNPRADMRENAQ